MTILYKTYDLVIPLNEMNLIREEICKEEEVNFILEAIKTVRNAYHTKETWPENIQALYEPWDFMPPEGLPQEYLNEAVIPSSPMLEIKHGIWKCGSCLKVIRKCDDGCRVTYFSEKCDKC